MLTNEKKKGCCTIFYFKLVPHSITSAECYRLADSSRHTKRRNDGKLKTKEA